MTYKKITSTYRLSESDGDAHRFKAHIRDVSGHCEIVGDVIDVVDRDGKILALRCADGQEANIVLYNTLSITFSEFTGMDVKQLNKVSNVDEAL